MRRLPVAIALLLIAAATFAQVPPRSISFPKNEVSDEFFGYLMGLFYGDYQARVSGLQLLELLPEFAEGESDVPFYDIVAISRTRDDGRVLLGVEFSRALDFPAPVDILGYQPATILTTQAILLEEVYLPSVEVQYGRNRSDTITRVRVFRMVEGSVRLEFARWVERLFGELIDDVDATIVFTLRYEGRWYAIVGGYEDDGGIISGVVDLTDTSVLIRPPRPLRSVAEQFMEPRE